MADGTQGANPIGDAIERSVTDDYREQVDEYDVRSRVQAEVSPLIHSSGSQTPFSKNSLGFQSIATDGEDSKGPSDCIL